MNIGECNMRFVCIGKENKTNIPHSLAYFRRDHMLKSIVFRSIDLKV